MLPDNAALDSEVTAADEIAEAIDPAVDVAEANQQLAEDLSADPSDYSVSAITPSKFKPVKRWDTMPIGSVYGPGISGD